MLTQEEINHGDLITSGRGSCLGLVSRRGFPVEISQESRPGKPQPGAEARGFMFKGKETGNAKALG